MKDVSLFSHLSLRSWGETWSLGSEHLAGDSVGFVGGLARSCRPPPLNMGSSWDCSPPLHPEGNDTWVNIHQKTVQMQPANRHGHHSLVMEPSTKAVMLVLCDLHQHPSWCYHRREPEPGGRQAPALTWSSQKALLEEQCPLTRPTQLSVMGVVTPQGDWAVDSSKGSGQKHREKLRWERAPVTIIAEHWTHSCFWGRWAILNALLSCISVRSWRIFQFLHDLPIPELWDCAAGPRIPRLEMFPRVVALTWGLLEGREALLRELVSDRDAKATMEGSDHQVLQRSFWDWFVGSGVSKLLKGP